jgi:hypothetical protein
VSDSRLWPLACRATRRTDFGGVRREGVQGEALRLAEEGGEWSAIRERSLLADDAGAIGDTSCSCAASAGSSTSVAGSPSLPDTGGSSGDAEGPVVVGNAIVRRVGGAGMRDGTAACFPLNVGSAGRTNAATRWTHSTTWAYSGRERSSGRAFKSLSCARQASRSTEVSATTWNDGGDIRKSKEKVRGRGGLAADHAHRAVASIPDPSRLLPPIPPHAAGGGGGGHIHIFARCAFGARGRRGMQRVFSPPGCRRPWRHERGGGSRPTGQLPFTRALGRASCCAAGGGGGGLVEAEAAAEEELLMS